MCIRWREFELQCSIFARGAQCLRILDLDAFLFDHVQAFSLPASRLVIHPRLQDIVFDGWDVDMYGTLGDVLMTLPSLAHLGADAEKEVTLLKMVLGDDCGTACTLTAWTCAEEIVVRYFSQLPF